MRVAVRDLALQHLCVVYPGDRRCPADERITMWPAAMLSLLRDEVE